MNESQEHNVGQKKSNTKKYIHYDFIYVKIKKQEKK